MAQTINIGNGTGATAVSVLCGTGACGFGNNGIAHTTTLGSSTGAATTTLQAGSGGLSLTSGGNIVLGTSDTTGTLLVLDSKTTTGDPTGANGGMYYNSADNKFRCYENSAWKSCTNGAADTFSTIYGAMSATGAKATAATILIAPLYVSGQITVNEMRLNVTTALGATGDVGIYNAAGTLVLNGGSGTISTGTGLKTIAPTQTGSARILEPGQYYAAVTWNSTTGVIAGSTTVAGGIVKRVGTITGGGSVLPASLTLSSITIGTVTPGVSINN